MERIGTIVSMKPNVSPGQSHITIKTNQELVVINCSNLEFTEMFQSDALPEINTLVKILEAPEHNVPRLIIPLDERMIPTKVVGKQSPIEPEAKPEFKRVPANKSKGSGAKSIPKKLGKGIWRVVKRRFYFLLGKLVYLGVLATLATIFLPGAGTAIWNSAWSMLTAVWHTTASKFL